MKLLSSVPFLASLTVCSLLTLSCRDDKLGTISDGNSSIRISVSGIGATKASCTCDELGKCVDSLFIEGSDGDRILVETFVSDYTDLPFQVETKGSVVNNTSINESGSKFIVNAWLGEENRYSGGPTEGRVYCLDDATDYHFIKNGLATKGSSEWSLKDGNGNFFIWRNAVPTSFWSYYPESLSENVTRTVTLPGSKAKDEAQKKFSFTYTIGDDVAATDLEDLLFAYNLATFRDGVGNSKVVGIHFYHALPAVRFDVSGLVCEDKVIKAITLEGLASSGSCELDGELDGEEERLGLGDSGNWTLGSGKVTVRQEFTASDFTESLQAFTSGKIFFPLPQPIKDSGIKVTMEYTHNGDNTVVTKSFVLDHNEPWESGKYYTYRLSLADNGVDLYVDDKVEGSEKSDLVIKNVGTASSYIRAFLAGNWVNKDGDILLEWDPEDESVGTIDWGSGNSAWTKGADGFYYHKAAVAPGAATAQLFEKYTVINRPSILEDSDYLEFIITAQSVLADEGKASATAAWGSVAAGYLNNITNAD